MTEDLSFLLATLATVVVLCAVLYGIRRAISNQALRDVLGIAMTFIVLGGSLLLVILVPLLCFGLIMGIILEPLIARSTQKTPSTH